MNRKDFFCLIDMVRQNKKYTKGKRRPPQEQRYFPRWEIDSPASYRHNDMIFETHVKDLTLSGACVYVDEELHPGEEIDLQIALVPGHQFQAHGTVLWKQSSDKHMYAGVAFEKIPQKTQNLILEHAFEFFR